MSNYGLSDKGFKRLKYDNIIERMEKRAVDLFGEGIATGEKTVLGLFFRVVAWFISNIWELAEKVYNSGYVDTAEGIQLDHVSKYIGITRLKALKATGEIKVYGQDGIEVEEGFLVETDGGVQFKTIQSGIINDGSVTLGIEAVEAGESGNVGSYNITNIVNPTVGIDEVNNENETSGGRDLESDEELRERYDRSISRVGSSTLESIRGTILDIDGVRDARVEHNNTMEEKDGIPPKSIAPFVFEGDDNEIANAILDTKAGGIKSHGDTVVTVEDTMGIEHDIGFTRPDKVDIYVKVDLQVNENYPIDGDTQVVTKIVEYIGGEDQDGQIYDGLGLNDDVVYTFLIYVMHEVAGIVDIDLYIDTEELEEPDSSKQVNIPISISEVAITSYEKVDVNSEEA